MVTLIPGDGIGPEVIAAAVAVIEATGVKPRWDEQIAGMTAFKRVGNPVPDALIRSLRQSGVALKGPLETRVGEGYRSINVYLRKTFNLYANSRPVHSFHGVHTPFRNVDLVVVRENTEDLYAGIEHQVAPGVVESIKVITARASKRIARFAFEYARREGRRFVTAIHKANIMKLSDGLFLKCARGVSADFPEIRYEEQIVDAACMRLVTDPQSIRRPAAGKPLRRHSFGPVRRAGRRPGRGSRSQLRRQGRHLRSGAWDRPGYRRQGNGQSDRGDPERRDVARLPGPSARGRTDSRRHRRGAAVGGER